jgi:hypothetical protein
VKTSKTKIWISVVIFLTVLNIASLTTIVFHIVNSGNVTTNNNTVGIEGNTTAYSGRYFRDRLRLNSEQMSDFRIVNNAFRNHARKINSQLIKLREEMLQEMQKSAPNVNSLDAYSDSIGMLHNELKRYTYHYYLGIKEICDPSQQQELNRIFKEFFIHDLHMGQYGNQGNRGNNGRRRYGQHRNKAE